jgi:hypothetical protein
MRAKGGPAPEWKTEPTTATLCWDETNLHINWTAADANIQFNCSGTSSQCCHDQVWEKDAVEFYLASGINASWDGLVHNVTEIDGGPKGGFWQGYSNNSGYFVDSHYLPPCDKKSAQWLPSIAADGWAGVLKVPWTMLPNVPRVLPESIWRLNFYRMDRGIDPRDLSALNASAWSMTYCDGIKRCNIEHVPKYFGVAQLMAQ